jgi:hypothetical protein
MSKRMARRLAARAGINPGSIIAREDGGFNLPLADGGRLAWMALPYDPEADSQWGWGRYNAEGWLVADGDAENATWLIVDLAAQLRAA